MAHEWPQGFTSEFFSPREFDHPELMDPSFIGDLDTVRMRCGFPVDITDDARTREELEALYAEEILKDQEAGQPYGWSWPEDSAHAVGEGGELVRCVDCKPSLPKPGDGSNLSLERRQLKLNHELGRMHDEGRWPKLGLGVETAHWHADDTPRLGPKRPAFWVAVSR